MHGWVRFFVMLAALLPGVSTAWAQTASIGGFVTDRGDGQPLEGATVALYHPAEGFEGVPAYGTATREGGVHLITRIRPGRYLLEISFIGYTPHRDTLDLVADRVQTVTVALEAESEALGEVVVETERTSGLARVTAGHQRIRPEEIELIPAPELSADLANYLSTLPGIVTSGDRGGQFFIRGGEPSQNLVLLDGIIVHQPFHLLGFYSVFPADVIDRVDFYAGGFGSRYSGHLSSVIDVTSRAGNNRRFTGSASVSPFTSAVHLEGPIVPGRASVLATARQSFIDQTSEPLYGEDLPFRFGDVFAKVQVVPGRRSRLAASFMRSADRGTLVKEIGDSTAQDIRWTNTGWSVNWMLLPRTIPVAMNLSVSKSRHEMSQGTPGTFVRFSSIRDTRIALDATWSEGSFFGGRSTTAAGWDVVMAYSRNRLGGLFQNIEDAAKSIPAFGLYVEPELVFDSGLAIKPGLRLHWYNVRHSPYFEPRLTARWQFGVHQLSGAVGVYQQQLIGLSDRRDAASVFTAWTGIPRTRPEIAGTGDNDVLRGRIGRSLHAILGYRVSPSGWLEYSIEGFYKRNTNLFVGEWTALPQFTTRLQTATGRSLGFETRAEARGGMLYGSLTYGYSHTLYAADGEAIRLWYATERLRYRPPHDRRHQVNAMVSTTFRSFEFSVRWQFGSGLPYTRPIAFDGFALVDDIKSAHDFRYSRRVIYERPFNSRLPSYHRLDLSAEKTWRLRSLALTVQASVINVYDRRNVFYVDVFTLDRKDQLPFMPSAGLRVQFE